MGIASLGYLGFKVSDLAAWNSFAASVLGLMPTVSPAGVQRYRADVHAWRIAVEQGDEDDLSYIGFETANATSLAALADQLKRKGISVEEASPELIKDRNVMGLMLCKDPDGLSVELYYGPTERTEAPFLSPVGVTEFVTREQGLGHVVLGCRNIESTRRFYIDGLGFRLSDIIRMQLSPEFGLDLEFYHCNPRHHTLALVPAPSPKRLHHFMLQAASLDDVGFAFDRAVSSGVRIAATLGKHTNDHMVSFYANTPSGFEVEFGYGAQEVDETAWRVVRHDKMSLWGHKR